MEDPLTPTRLSPRLGRCHTPPSPTHGPMTEEWEPHSPRRSSRATLKTNPFSSYNTSNSAKQASNSISVLQTPARKPVPAFKLRHLGAVPSPPISPPANSRLSAHHHHNNKSDDDNSNSNLDRPENNAATSSGMLPTPSKTPSMTPARKRHRAASMQDTARVLHFQPNDPNDVMPSRRENRKRANKRAGKLSDFDLDIDTTQESGCKAKVSFEIYTESHARMPEVDESEENVFYRPQQPRVAPQARSSPRRSRGSTAQLVEGRRMDEAVARNEGLVYTL